MQKDNSTKATDTQPKTFAVTGHRPDKLGGYGPSANAALIRFAETQLALRRSMIAEVITGMALGWDQAIAEAALALGIPIIAAVPFAGQDAKWQEGARDRYLEILKLASEVVIVSPGGYSPEKMHLRNRWMVDRAQTVLALWDGSNGGTCNAVRYAYSKGVTTANLWPFWKDYLKTSEER